MRSSKSAETMTPSRTASHRLSSLACLGTIRELRCWRLFVSEGILTTHQDTRHSYKTHTHTLRKNYWLSYAEMLAGSTAIPRSSANHASTTASSALRILNCSLVFRIS